MSKQHPFEQNRQLFDFRGGIHLPHHKEKTSATPIQSVPLAEELILPIKQHVGQKSEPIVEVGQYVQKGEPLTQGNNLITVPIHASTSGTISAIKPHVIAHPSGLTDLCIFLKPDGTDTPYPYPKTPDYQTQSPQALIEIIRQAGIAGLGGGVFPTAVKIAAAKTRIKTLIINAVECEPYISADDRLMQEHAQDIMQGIAILQHILKPASIVIAIENDKPVAIASMQSVCPSDIEIITIPSKYPSGGEKQLIEIITGQQVPKQGLPIDLGVLVQNVGTVFAIQQAVIYGRPLISRVVTITGALIPQPANIWVPLGTPITHLLQHFGLHPESNHQRIIIGGPMMGFTLPQIHTPVSKTCNCILVLNETELPVLPKESPCIRCGACSDACPAGLLPQQLYWFAKGHEYEKAKAHDLFECIECGICAFVCPSQIPLVQYYRVAKSNIREKEREQNQAKRAKERFEQKQIRLEKEKQAREARIQAIKAKASATANQQEINPTVAEAIARVKSRKKQTPPTDDE